MRNEYEYNHYEYYVRKGALLHDIEHRALNNENIFLD